MFDKTSEGTIKTGGRTRGDSGGENSGGKLQPLRQIKH